MFTALPSAAGVEFELVLSNSQRCLGQATRSTVDEDEESKFQIVPWRKTKAVWKRREIEIHTCLGCRGFNDIVIVNSYVKFKLVGSTNS